MQKAVIPRILSGENLLMAASTGSGKTLAYMLPCMQELRIEEEQGYARRPKRPRCIVLVPTRELARQVLHSVKQIGHYSKVASTAVLGGEQYGEQTKQVLKRSLFNIRQSRQPFLKVLCNDFFEHILFSSFHSLIAWWML